jgi:beta-lactam-binding protein with PASTA domain
MRRLLIVASILLAGACFPPISGADSTRHDGVVPDVDALSEANGIEILHQFGLRVAVVKVHTHRAFGVIVAQQPRGGVEVLRGAVVRINVSLGPKKT